MRLLILSAAALALAGCQPTREQLVMQARQDAEVCKSYGFKAGTPEISNCAGMIAQQRQAQRQQAADAAFLMGAAILANNAATQGQPIGPTPPLNCTTRPNGIGGTSVSCF